jgi:hypothetical protein
MVLYATQPKTLSPADPCNKVCVRSITPSYHAAIYPRVRPKAEG